jgi:hypothetical protein
MGEVHIYLIRFGGQPRTPFIPHLILFFSFFRFPFLAGDIGQMNLPVGMQTVNFMFCERLTGTAESLE